MRARTGVGGVGEAVFGGCVVGRAGGGGLRHPEWPRTGWKDVMFQAEELVSRWSANMY